MGVNIISDTDGKTFLNVNKIPSSTASLPVVYFLLDGARCEKPVDGDLLLLSDPPRPLTSLGVRAGVPVRVKDYHTVRSSQVHTQTPDSRCQQKHIDGWILEPQE